MDQGLKKCLPATILLTLFCFTSCERRTDLSIKDELSPSFQVIGVGYELFFGIGEVTQEKDQFGRKELPVWSFKSKQRSEHVSWPTIAYGKLSEEFQQTFPNQGNPMPLVEGKIYGVHATIYSTSGDNLWFVMKNGKAVKVSKPE